MDISETCVKTVGIFRCCLEAPEKLKIAEYGDTVRIEMNRLFGVSQKSLLLIVVIGIVGVLCFGFSKLLGFVLIGAALGSYVGILHRTYQENKPIFIAFLCGQKYE